MIHTIQPLDVKEDLIKFTIVVITSLLDVAIPHRHMTIKNTDVL